MRADLDVNSFSVNLDVRIHFKSKSEMFYDNTGKPAWVLINLDVGMCQVGHTMSYDGGLTFHWNCMNNYAIRESKEGLQYFDQHGSMGWRFFDDTVQEAFAQYAIEKEIK